MRHVFTISFICLLACDANLGSVATSESGSEGDDATSASDGDGDGDPIACIAGELCPIGTSCQNGVCETDCDADDDCDADEFCGLDELCHPNTVPTCGSDQDCAPSQTCVEHSCTATDAPGCDLDNYLMDGCPSNAICLGDYETEQGTCYAMPACGSDHTCPIGVEGAVCNTGQLVAKDEICLISWCDVEANCPEFWSCVRFDNAVLGACSNGGFGALCSENGHCLSDNCVLIPGVGGGFCG